MALAKQKTSLEIATAMLKEVEPVRFKELLSGIIIKATLLNKEAAPDEKVLTMIVEELYVLLRQTWPGVKPQQLWWTVKGGMARQGQYSVRINYSTLANWFVYHKVLVLNSEIDKRVDDFDEPIQEKARKFLTMYRDWQKGKEIEK